MRLGVRREGIRIWFKCVTCGAEKEVRVRAEASDNLAVSQGEIYLSTIGWKGYGDILCPKCLLNVSNETVDKITNEVVNDLYKTVKEACDNENNRVPKD